MNTERIEGDRVADVVPRMLAAQLHQPIEAVTLDARLVSDLSADELDMVEIVGSLEGEYRITIDDADEPHLATVRGCIGLVERKLAGVPAASGAQL